MPPSDRTIPEAAVRISSTDPAQLRDIHSWVHDRRYNPADIRYNTADRVRDYAVRDQGGAMIKRISVPRPGEFRIDGVSEITGRIDRFEVSVETGDRIIGWVRMRGLLIAEIEGRIQPCNDNVDDRK